MKVFWILLGLIVTNVLVSVFFLKSFWLLISIGIWCIVGGVVFWSSLTTARSNYTLKREQFRLANVITNLKDGVIVYDQNFTVAVFNPAAEEIFNLKASDIIGRSFTLRAGQGNDNDQFKIFLATLFPALAPVVHRYSEPHADVQVADLSFDDPAMDLRVTTTKLYHPSGAPAGFMKVVRDRTRDLQILRSKSEFITVASHQLRAPLTAVNWVLETLEKEPMTDNQKELIQVGTKAAGNLLKIVNDLLDVAKIEEGRFGYQFQEIDVVAFLQEALRQADLVARQYRVKVYFEKPAKESVIVIGDAQKLETAVSNLIDNAIKYNVPNGEVTVKVEWLEDQPYVQVSIHDTGVGIPSEVMDKLFTKFFRAENALKLITEGTGLGLFITKNIIRRHGGKVWAKSELNRGSTFFFTLPTDSKMIPLKEIIYEEEI